MNTIIIMVAVMTTMAGVTGMDMTIATTATTIGDIVIIRPSICENVFNRNPDFCTIAADFWNVHGITEDG